MSKVTGSYVKFCHGHSTNMVALTANFENFIFRIILHYILESSRQIWGKLAQEEKSYIQKQN